MINGSALTQPKPAIQRTEQCKSMSLNVEQNRRNFKKTSSIKKYYDAKKYFIGADQLHNRDDHSKNFSYLLTEKRKWTLAPSYDISFNIGPGGEHQMDICGEGRNPDRSSLQLLAEKSGLSKKICATVIDCTLDVARNFKNKAKNHHIRSATVNAMDKLIQANVKRLIS